MPYSVLLLEEAVQDIEAIYRHIRNTGNAKAARDLVSNLRRACGSLSEHPERGHIPPELSRASHFEYRQIIHNRFRVIYQVSKPNVFIFGIIHGARNIADVLKQRLLR
jgi:plasmid stabilization system protein ParE